MHKKPTLKITPLKVYVLQTSEKDPYILKDLVSIKAVDSTGIDISKNVVISADSIDYSKSGDYSVTAAVLDNDNNMTLTTFVVSVLTSEQADKLENQNKFPSKSNKNSYKEGTGSKHKLRDFDQLFDNFVSSVVKNSVIWIICSVIVITLILFFAEMFI